MKDCSLIRASIRAELLKVSFNEVLEHRRSLLFTEIGAKQASCASPLFEHAGKYWVLNDVGSFRWGSRIFVNSISVGYRGASIVSLESLDQCLPRRDNLVALK